MQAYGMHNATFSTSLGFLSSSTCPTSSLHSWGYLRIILSWWNHEFKGVMYMQKRWAEYAGLPLTCANGSCLKNISIENIRHGYCTWQILWNWKGATAFCWANVPFHRLKEWNYSWGRLKEWNNTWGRSFFLFLFVSFVFGWTQMLSSVNRQFEDNSTAWNMSAIIKP